MAEVKRAYRLLAKAFHPDSAGEAALPRFLAIHEAYEELRTGRVAAARRTTPTTSAPQAAPWRADPERARAAREQARTARNGSARPTGSTGRPGPRSGAAGTSRPSGSAPPSGASGSAGPSTASGSAGSARPSTGARGSGRRRDTRKATMGSTSYDDARDHSDATWSGASWYGPTTGEYWIVNPREYADPRKHGPEYQSRARRPADAGSPDPIEPEAVTEQTTEAPIGAAPGRSSTAGSSGPAAPGPPPATPPSPDREPASRRLASEPAAAPPSASTWGTPSAGERPPDGVPFRRPGDAPPGDAPGVLRVEAFGAASRAWLGGPADDPIRRLGLALVAWPPLGLAAAAVIGDVTGCSVYSANCGGTEPLLPWLAQAVILGLLLLLPPLTRLLAGGALAVLIALVPSTAFLVSVGGTGAPQAGFALAVLLSVAWLVGVGWSAAMAVRRRQVARAGP
jgi:hypothetical protein